MYSRLVKGFIPVTATCKGDYDDPLLRIRIIKFRRTLQSLLKTGSRCVLVDAVTPWNSIRIKLRLSHDACLRLRELAQQRNQLLAELGILSLDFENDNQTFAIVDVPSSAGTSADVAGTSYSGSQNAPANNYSFLLGNAPPDSADSKHFAGVRRALPHSATSEFSSSPKVAKRASGVRRPRGSRSVRGSRGGSSRPLISSAGRTDNLSFEHSKSNDNSSSAPAASGCELQKIEVSSQPPAEDSVSNSQPFLSSTTPLQDPVDSLRPQSTSNEVGGVVQSESLAVDRLQSNPPVTGEAELSDVPISLHPIRVAMLTAHSLTLNGCSLSNDNAATVESIAEIKQTVNHNDSEGIPPQLCEDPLLQHKSNTPDVETSSVNGNNATKADGEGRDEKRTNVEPGIRVIENDSGSSGQHSVAVTPKEASPSISLNGNPDNSPVPTPSAPAISADGS